MFVDEVRVIVAAGRGGNGKVAFFSKRGGPCGGDGGNGGNVIARIDPQMSNLNQYTRNKVLQANSGGDGGPNNRLGRTGQDLIVRFPNGTTLKNVETGEEVELIQGNIEEVVLAQGGLGGRGNNAFKSPTNQAPHNAEAGKPGSRKQFHVIVKLIADYGLIGLPNAGKSSLLNELTKAQARTAPYPFTTLEPNMGALEGKIIADIPGLIENASQGKGLGARFLKHIEKVKILLHCISVESIDIENDYHTVINELQSYNPSLVRKESILLLTKIDLVKEDVWKKKLHLARKLQPKVLAVSIHDPSSIRALRKALLDNLHENL